MQNATLRNTYKFWKNYFYSELIFNCIFKIKGRKQSFCAFFLLLQLLLGQLGKVRVKTQRVPYWVRKWALEG